MTITQLKKEIFRAIDMEINRANEVNIDGLDMYKAETELKDLKQFIKKCFKDYERGE